MKTNFVPIKAVIQDWIEDSGSDMTMIDEGLIVKYATDATRDLITDEQLQHHICMVPISNFTGNLPDNFKFVQSVAGRKTQGKCVPTSTQRVSQWVQHTYEQECDLEINVVCSKCHKTKCDCNSPVIEVDVDRIWELSNPQHFLSGYDRWGRFGYGDYSMLDRDTGFKLMKSANGDFSHLNRFFMQDSPSVIGAAYGHTFNISPPVIRTDFQNGEVLLSYLGTKLDENGDLLVPDHAEVFRTVFWYIEAKLAWRRFRQSGNTADFEVHQVADSKWNRALGFAKSALQYPDYKTFSDFIRYKFTRRLKDPENYFNNYDNRQIEKYDKILNEGRSGLENHRII